MAKISPKKKTKKATSSSTKKYYPVQNQGVARLSSGATSGMIFGNRLMSRWNKRLYRQSRFYQMKIDLDVREADNGPIVVYALRNTWGNHKAYQMAYQEYLDSTAEERSRIGKDQVSRWQDFTVQSGSTAGEMLGRIYDETGVEGVLSVGEFSDTLVEDKNGNTMRFTWGTDVPGTHYGIRAQYELKANTDDSPVTNGEDVPYAQQSSDTSNVEVDQLRNRGNDAPYHADVFGDAWTIVAVLSRVAGQQKMSTGYFTAPCGLVLLTGLDPVTRTPVIVDFKMGDYKGIKAPSMLE